MGKLFSIFSNYFERLLLGVALLVCVQVNAQNDLSYQLRHYHVVSAEEAESGTGCSQSFVETFCKGLFGQIDCEICLPCVGDTMPSHYCDCLDGIPFQYGLDTILSDTIWYRTVVKDILDGGIAAYWFSSNEVSIDLFIMCSLTTPNKKISLTKNTSEILSTAQIKAILGSTGDLGDLFQTKPVYIRVAPTGPGRVVITKYGEGFPTQCDEDIEQLEYSIFYAVSKDETAFSISHEDLPKFKFANWKQQKNKPLTLILRTGDCLTGNDVDKFVFNDTLRPYFPRQALLDSLYNTGESVYVILDADDYGKVQFHDSMRFSTKYNTTKDTIMCQGAPYLNGLIINQDTTILDTTWVTSFWLALTTVNIQVITPEPIMDTLLVKYNKLPFFHHGEYIYDFGDYDISEILEDGCTARYLVHVGHDWIYDVSEKHQTECQGKSITVGGIAYSTDTVVIDTVDNIKADLRSITTHILEFTPPTLEYDTVYYYKTDLPQRYIGTCYVRAFGDTTFLVSSRNACDRLIQVTVEERKLPLQYKNIEIDTTLCLGAGLDLFYFDTLVFDAGRYQDSILIAEDTMLCITYNLSFEQYPPMSDTIYIMQRELPYIYKGAKIDSFGEYNIFVEPYNDCHQQVALVVLPENEYIVITVDTTLCRGLAEQLVNDTVQLDTYLYGVTVWNITIVEPEEEMMVVEATERQIPINVEGTELDYGTHRIETTTEDGCLRLIDVTVVPKEETILIDSIISTCHGKSITFRGKTYYEAEDITETIQVSEYTWHEITYHITFTAPELIYETLVVEDESNFPLDYLGTRIEDYGTYTILLAAKDECDVMVVLTVAQTAALNNVKRSTLEVIPSIAKAGQVMNITIPNQGTLEVMDVVGRQVLHQTVTTGIMPLQINVPGNYFIQLQTQDELLTRRVIIE